MAGSSRKSIGHFLALTLMAWGFSVSVVASDSNVRYAIANVTDSEDNAFGSQASACLSDIAKGKMERSMPSAFHNPELTGVVVYGGGSYNCEIKATTYYNNDPRYPPQEVITSGYVYLKEKSGCQLTQGQAVEFKGPDSPIIWSGTSGYVLWVPDDSAETCFRACQYVGQAKTECYFLPGTESSGYCNYFSGGTGEVCDMPSSSLAADGAPITRPEPTDPTGPTDPTDPTNPGGGSSGSPVTPPEPVEATDPDAATTGDVAGLGNRLVSATYDAANGIIGALNGLGSKVDGVGEKVDGLGDKLDSLNGEPYSEGASEAPGNGTDGGAESGDSLAELIDQAVADADQARTDTFNDELAKVDGMVSEWFGEDASSVGGSILDGMFPKASGCSNFVVQWNPKGYSISLPVCELTRFKAILEWVFGVLTAIAVWRIIMNGLNQAATSAVRYS